jgi:hypothetical protein
MMVPAARGPSPPPFIGRNRLRDADPTGRSMRRYQVDVRLQRALESLDDTTRALSPDRMARPIPGRWTIRDILDHLTLAYSHGTRSLERALAAGECRARYPTPLEWLARILVIDIGYFPPVKAPEAAQPRGTIPPERVREAARDSLIALDDALTRAAMRFGDRTPVINHPYFAGLTVDQWRRFHLRHTRHHMAQVRERARTA